MDSHHPGFEVPPEFHSFLNDGPFQHCTVCNTYLLDDGTYYFIEKAFKKEEVIFEVALCIDCHTKLHQEISIESRTFIEQSFMQRVDFDKRRNRLAEAFEGSINPWISHCLVTEQPIRETECYQLCTVCEGPRLFLTDMPFMISGAVIEDMQKHLSKKTRDRFDDFTEEFLGLPPEVRDLNLLLI